MKLELLTQKRFRTVERARLNTHSKITKSRNLIGFLIICVKYLPNTEWVLNSLGRSNVHGHCPQCALLHGNNSESGAKEGNLKLPKNFIFKRTLFSELVCSGRIWNHDWLNWSVMLQIILMGIGTIYLCKIKIVLNLGAFPRLNLFECKQFDCSSSFAITNFWKQIKVIMTNLLTWPV